MLRRSTLSAPRAGGGGKTRRPAAVADGIARAREERFSQKIASKGD
jgi:hypothetical protein